MTDIQVQVSKIVDASPAVVYAVLADYEKGHPSILPQPYFTECTVLEGGQGAGTKLLVRMSVMGTNATYQLSVTEPEPGRMMVETDPDAGIITSFLVEPVEDGTRSKVTISTVSKASAGFRGMMERMMNPSITRRIYNKELEQLNQAVTSKKV